MFRIVEDQPDYSVVLPEGGEGEEGTNSPSLQYMRNALENIDNQPYWRAQADKEMDYKDGNQLDSDILVRQEALGIPPAIEPLIGPTIGDITGMEKKTRTDWRVIPDGDVKNDDIALALNYKINQAERHSKADKACSDAYESQVSVGLGWVEVGREKNPFKFKYKCRSIHRNEIWWDWLSRENDLSDCRWLLRRKWTDADVAMKLFPDKAELLRQTTHGWHGFDIAELDLDGGRDTGLAKSLADERGWSREEQEWRDVERNRVCLFELWYREYVNMFVLKFKDGRVVEFDETNEAHEMAVWAGVEVVEALVGKMKLAFFAGPHLLWEGDSPHPHDYFPYVPFWGLREDRTGVPYGLIRGMMFLQDEINARVSKQQWLLSAKRVVRTQHAVMDSDPVFRSEIARPDADIILNAEAMANDGIFKVEQDLELNSQQAARLVEARESLKRVARVTEAFQGVDKTGRQSGSALSQLVEQTVQGLADVNDNFAEGRAMVGQLILELELEDLKDKETTIVVDGNTIAPDREITLNQPATDPETGYEYRTNDTQRVKLRVIMSDVPSTPSFRAQQATVMQETFKSAPDEFQKIMMPHLMNLVDLPLESKKEIITAIRELSVQPTEEDIQQRIDDAVSAAKMEMQFSLKEREVKIKEDLAGPQMAKLVAEAVRKDMETIFASVQTGREIVATPEVAPIADQTLDSVGFVDKDAPPIVGLPGVGAPVVATGGEVADQSIPSSIPPLEENTSPTFPPRAAVNEINEAGSEFIEPVEVPGVGVNEGIEGGE